MYRFYGTGTTAEVVTRSKEEVAYFFHHDRETIHVMPAREFKRKTFAL